ncbi:CLUMA_CG015147, isoform A [Clunio marinus]|uniref:CLUMA_CG015147, isoform A n=1 Tax=Clunio marinus TaxID=568069 RepID=A0A1J1ITH8_9DIPT|nr:CLUMA_CG015147, isoform A [Clunio marinus]
MLVFKSLFVLLTISTIFAFNFTNFLNDSFYVLKDEIETREIQDDIIDLISSILIKFKVSKVSIITDSIYKGHLINTNLIDSLEYKIIFMMSIKDSEAFDEKPSGNIETMLRIMKREIIDAYVILITNGIQMSSFLKFADYYRLLNSQALIILLHDYRLLSPNFHYLWKRIVNVILIRKCETIHKDMYEILTVPFPEKIREILVLSTINYWSPLRGFKWKHKIFDTRAKNNQLNGVELNIVVLEHTPTVFKQLEENETIGYYGLEIDLITTLSSVMNFSTNFYESEDAITEKWGKKVSQAIFSGMLNEMDQSRADIAIADLHYTSFNLDIMDLSLPYNVECLTFITPETLGDNSWKTLILPFSFEIWIGVLTSGKPTEKLQYFIKDLFDEFSACILYTYSMILVVSLPRLPFRWSIRVLTGWWLIYCLLVVVAYRAALTSILANPQPRLTIDTIEMLANSLLKCGAWGEQNKNIFLSSSDPASQKIGTKVEHIDNADKAIEQVAQGEFAYFENRFTLQQLRMQHEQQKDSIQNLHIMDECVINMPISIGIEKNSPLKEQIDKFIRYIIEAGLIKKWLMDSVKGFESNTESQPEEALMDLKKFSGALVALVCGYVFAILVFTIEKCYWKFIIEKHPYYDKYFRAIKLPKIKNTEPQKITKSKRPMTSDKKNHAVLN